MHSEILIRIVFWLATAVLCVNVGMFVFVFYRRLSRTRYYGRKDRARQRFAAVVTAIVEDRVAPAQAARSLASNDAAERDCLRELLIAASHRNLTAATTTAIELGFLKEWTRQAFGARRAAALLKALPEKAAPAPPRSRYSNRIRGLRLFAVRRAMAIANIAHLESSTVRELLCEGLHDPSPLVVRTAVAALGTAKDVALLPLLLQELREAVLAHSNISVRTIKTAIARYPASALPAFTPFLRDESPRMRFLVIDSVREICTESPAPVILPQELVTLVLQNNVTDTSADVRARTAAVVARIESPEAVAALRKLMRDENEFVRLHAVRSCAVPYFEPLLDDVMACVTDSFWRVREAAVRTMFSFGEQGEQRLMNCLLTSSDRFACEQIIEETQRNGVLAKLIGRLESTEESAGMARTVCHKLVSMGKTAALLDQLQANRSDKIRAALLDILSASPKPDVLTAIAAIANSPADALAPAAARITAAHAVSAGAN